MDVCTPTPACTHSYTSTLYEIIAGLCMLQVYVQLLYIKILKWSQIKLSWGPTQKGCNVMYNDNQGVPYTLAKFSICYYICPSLVPGLSSYLFLQSAFETNTGLATRFCKLREPLTSFIVAVCVELSTENLRYFYII